MCKYVVNLSFFEIYFIILILNLEAKNMVFIKSHAENSKTLVTIPRPHKKNFRRRVLIEGLKIDLDVFLCPVFTTFENNPFFFSQ